jgi:hypothetical protein
VDFEAQKQHVLLNSAFISSPSFCCDEDFWVVSGCLPITKMHPAATREFSHDILQKLAKYVASVHTWRRTRIEVTEATEQCVCVLYYRQEYEQRVLCRRYDWRCCNNAHKAVSSLNTTIYFDIIKKEKQLQSLTGRIFVVLISEYSSKICPENSSFAKIWQEYRVEWRRMYINDVSLNSV